MKLSMSIKNICLITTLLVSTSVTASDQWPMYQANPSHSGYMPVDINPSDISFRWKKQLGSLALNPVTAAAGEIFVSETGYFNDQNLYVLSKNGKLLWSQLFTNVFSINPPSYANGKVYIQTGNHASDTYLRAYNAKNGNLVFKSPHGAQWERYFAPTIYKGTVYINGGGYGGMYSFDGKSGTQNWSTGLQQYDQWTPAVDERWAYAYVGDSSPALYVIDRLTGLPVFNIPDPGFQWDGWSMNLAPVLGGANDVFAIHDGRLIKFNTKTRKIQWQKANNYTGQPTIANGVIYAISSGVLGAFNQSTGYKQWLWEAPLGENLQSNIIATKSHVFVGTATKTYCIDLKTHRDVWSYSASGHLSLAESALYIADGTGTLTAFKLGLSDLLAPSSMSFVTPTAINTTKSRSIKIKNVGDKPLMVSDIASGLSVFKVETTPTSFLIAPNQSKTITISFTPTTAAILETDLIIKSDDPNEPEMLVHLKGKGI